MIAVIVVRDEALPAGAEECLAEAGGRGIVIGTGAEDTGLSGDLTYFELGPFGPARYAEALVGWVPAETVVMPGSPDGRDLAPRLAAALGWPLVAPAIAVGEGWAHVVRHNGRVIEEIAVDGPFVATLVPGVRGVSGHEPASPREWADRTAGLQPLFDTRRNPGSRPRNDPELVALLPPDPSTMSLVEATRIVAGGQGLGSTARFEQLARIGVALGASLGGTRVASDAGWIPFERQIGTTGVAVNPRVYVAFAISGATQHTSGLGDPEHIISVNTDAACPMMALADIAIVSDANAVLDALERRLGL